MTIEDVELRKLIIQCKQMIRKNKEEIGNLETKLDFHHDTLKFLKAKCPHPRPEHARRKEAWFCPVCNELISASTVEK